MVTRNRHQPPEDMLHSFEGAFGDWEINVNQNMIEVYNQMKNILFSMPYPEAHFPTYIETQGEGSQNKLIGVFSNLDGIYQLTVRTNITEKSSILTLFDTQHGRTLYFIDIPYEVGRALHDIGNGRVPPLSYGGKRRKTRKYRR